MEPLNQEQDNGTVDSVAGSDVNDFDMESADEVIHDQLPSVEEYKASLPSGCPSRSNTDQRSSYGNASSEDVANFDDSASYIQDQLPTVEEIKAMSGRGDNGWGVIHYFAIFVGLVALTVVIVVPTLLTQERESGGTDPPVTAPTIPPMERKQNIIQYLSDAGVSTTTQLTTSGTPQSKAVDWMTVEDELYMLVPQTSKKYTRFIERYVLAVVYFSTNGPAWKYKMNFMTGVDHCDWYDNFLSNTGIIVQHGVASCSSVPASDETEGGQMTTTLSIPLNDLVGRFPTELQYLHRLQTLYAPSNRRLRGNLEFGLEKLEHLESLEMQYCGLVGSIPSEIGLLTKLTKLMLGNNDLSGDLPASFFELTALEMLGLDDGLLQGNIGSFGKLTNLKQAYLEDNQFTGELTDTLLSAWSVKMEELDLSRNLINSTLPASIFAMTNLVVLDLNGNSIRGPIPEVTGPNGALMLLALHDNDLTGQIPATLSKLNALRHLDLAKNKLTSPIPESIGSMTDLRYLFMGGNEFSRHSMPMFLWGLTDLRELSMKNNSITGSIPAAIGSLAQLQVLDLDANRLTGSIPGELGVLSGLKHLLLNRNSLSGTLPSSLTLLYNLKIFLIDNNKINGTADVICKDENIVLSYFVADCEGPNENIQCSCCHLCCNDLNATCNNLGWSVNMDPIWEYDYTRNVYDFSNEVIASEP